MTATILDVARRAGVSPATVSRVLTGSAPAREATRARILQAAAELRYVPNGAARSLSSRRTGAIGVLLPDLHGEFFSELLRGLDRAAQAHAHHLLVSSSHHDREGVEQAVRAMRGRVDGVVVMAPDLDAEALAAALPAGWPVALVNCADGAAAAVTAAHAVPGAGGQPVTTLAVDNAGGARAMTAHLVALGHQRVGYVGGPRHNADSAARRRGHRDALRAAGLSADPALEVHGDFGEASGRRAAGELLALPDPPTAIFAANDMMAVGALGALADRGLRAPDDVSVAGFDDIPLARYTAPALTTVRVAIAELGVRAAEALLATLGARGPAERPPPGGAPGGEPLPAALVVRASTGPPPAPARRRGDGPKNVRPLPSSRAEQ